MSVCSLLLVFLQIINVYFGLIQERSREVGYSTVNAFYSFFFPKLMEQGYSSVCSWASKVNLQHCVDYIELCYFCPGLLGHKVYV